MHDAPAGSPPSMPIAAEKPPSLTVFGVVHLVLAALGLLGAAWSIASVFLRDVFMPADSPAMALQREFDEAIAWTTWLSTGFTLILAGLLIISGIKLLRGTRDSVQWSNRYAWTSIAMKLIGFLIAITVIAPAMRDMMRETMAEDLATAPEMNGFADGLSIGMSVAVILSPVLGCIYPALCLILLKRPRIAQWLAVFGK